MNKEVELDDIIDIIIEKLDSGGTVTFTPNGTSMLPMLRDGKDIVVLSKKKGRLRLFDLPLYKRKNGTYVLHRVVGYDDDDGYILCGDNQFKFEHGIKDEDIIAVVSAFHRKGKVYTVDSLSYRLYLYFWYHTRAFRHAYRFGKRKTGRIFSKFIKSDENKSDKIQIDETDK